VAAPSTPFGFPAAGIDDGVVRLRFRTKADLPAIAEAARDDDVQRWTRVPEDYDLEKAHEFYIQGEREAREGKALHLVVADAADNAFLGSCGVVEMIVDEQRCEIGYWLAPWARGRGVMTRSVRLLCAWLLEELAMQRIAAGAEPGNPTSQAVLERVGFQREGITRSLFEEKGRRRDYVYFSLLPGELVTDA
jgi:RimJ/RimL family protein N-acetyltransferase